MCAILLKPDYVYTYKVLEELTGFLTKHLPPLSNSLDQILNKVMGKDDPIRFLYYNKMNLAIKFSNMLTKDIFNLDLILLLNQMHDTF